ncbi:hypothetical protein CDL15_Pgr004567 [Punica granatum]|uniref:XRCC4 N-terminal domain-containing protein n=1 Tax=Punica granatum TaxID=22663 RepID=A0A218WR14_PUNGR|nr:hypothetical protein CDL15_Pgr004567 [Punica granatum]
MMESPRHSCLKLELPNTIEPDQIEPIFIEATWYDTHFDLSIMNGLNSWVCTASEEEVRERAAQWDQPVADYIELAERITGAMFAGEQDVIVVSLEERKKAIEVLMETETGEELRKKVKEIKEKCRVAIKVLPVMH